MPYPWRLRSDSIRRINMSREPGNESFLCALRPIPRILSLLRRDCASQVRDVNPAPTWLARARGCCGATKNCGKTTTNETAEDRRGRHTGKALTDSRLRAVNRKL